jgi:hypothetical protein
MSRALRTVSRVLAISALTAGSLSWPGMAVRADDIRTTTKLAGFGVTVEADPLRILLDDPKLQIPRPTGSAALEADPNYTLALVSAGPNAHAITSTLWPGNLLGAGLAQVADGAPAYPLKGEALYPDKPYEADGPDGGQLGHASAEGLVAKATANAAPADKTGQLTIGSASAVSSAQVDDKDVAIGTAISSVKDVDLLGGIVHLDGVTTNLVTKADGHGTSSTGSTVVSGLTIAGQAFTVDDKGLHAAGNGSALPALGTPSAVNDALGISVEAIQGSATKSGNGVSRVAGGLVIRVDTAPLRKLLAPATTVINPVLNGLISQMPAQAQGNLYYLVKATPNITFIFGSANSSSAATLPITFSFPPASFPLGTGGLGGPVASGNGGLAPGGGPVPPALDPVPPGVVAGPPMTANGPLPTVNASSSHDAGGGGLSAGLLLGALAVSGLLGWGLLRFLGLAGGGLLGFGCRLGAPTTVPDLRSVTA